MTARRRTAWAVRSYRTILNVVLRRRHDRDAVDADAQTLLRHAAESGARPLAFTWTTLVIDALVTGVRHDLVHATRAVLRSPGFTITVSLILGVGIAVAATLFAFIDAVLLRPLPYSEPHQLVMLWETSSTQDRMREGPSPANVIDWNARNQAFDALTAWMTMSMTLRDADGATPVTGVQVTRGFFDVFRRQPLLGRTFASEEYNGAAWRNANQFVGGEPLLVLSHRLWRNLGSDAGIVNRTIRVEGRQWRVVGVMPGDFAVPDVTASFWTPWDMTASYRGARFPDGPPRDFRFLDVAARLKPTVSIGAANSHMQLLAAELANEHPANRGWSTRVVPLADEIVGGTRTELVVVFGAVMCLLVLVCSNVAGLTLSRAASRAREMAIRVALGAGRARIARQMIAETAIVACLSAALGLLLTAWWLAAAVAFAPPDIPRLHEVAFNRQLVLFVGGLVALMTVLTGIIPAARRSPIALTTTLKEGAAASGDSRVTMRRVLVIAELAVAVMLLAGAGLLARSFVGLQRVDPGFNPDNLLVLRVTPDVARYPTGAQAAVYYRRVMDALRQVPAVISVGAVTNLPMSTFGSNFTRPFWADGAQPAADRVSEAEIRMATPDYFRTLERPVVAGREFSDRDTRDAPRVVIINERLAKQTWPSIDAVGQTVILDYLGGVYPYQVVGIVRNARYDGPRSDPEPEIFIPHAQNPYLVMNVIVRTSIPPEGVAQSARAHALAIDPDQPVHSITTMRTLIAGSVAQDRFATLLLTLFSIAGIVVAATGVYSLLAFAVVQRRREIAVRMAIGASRRDVGRMLMLETLVLAAVGTSIGLAGALMTSGMAQALLFEISPQDPWTLAWTIAIVLVIVIAATWLPTRQAVRVDPATVIRG
jgi:putative ABC transport system permease protein